MKHRHLLLNIGKAKLSDAISPSFFISDKPVTPSNTAVGQLRGIGELEGEKRQLLQ